MVQAGWPRGLEKGILAKSLMQGCLGADSNYQRPQSKPIQSRNRSGGHPFCGISSVAPHITVIDCHRRGQHQENMNGEASRLTDD